MWPQSGGLTHRAAVGCSGWVGLSSPGLALSQAQMGTVHSPRPVPSPPAAPCSAEGEEARCTLGCICLGLAWLLKAELCRPLESLAGCAGRSSGGQASAPVLSLTDTCDSHHRRKQPPQSRASSRHSGGRPTLLQWYRTGLDRPGKARPLWTGRPSRGPAQLWKALPWPLHSIYNHH